MGLRLQITNALDKKSLEGRFLPRKVEIDSSPLNLKFYFLLKMEETETEYRLPDPVVTSDRDHQRDENQILMYRTKFLMSRKEN